MQTKRGKGFFLCCVVLFFVARFFSRCVKTWNRGPIGCDENIGAMIFGSHSRNCLEFLAMKIALPYNEMSP